MRTKLFTLPMYPNTLMPKKLNAIHTDKDMSTHPALMSSNREWEDGCEARRLRTMDIL